MEPTVGVIQSGGEMLWARYRLELGEPRFTAGRWDAQGAETVLLPRLTALGISAEEVVFRSTTLPFQKSEQIRQVLSQELVDTLVEQPDSPHIAFSYQTDDDGQSTIFYGVTDQDRLKSVVDSYSDASIKANHYWLSEVGSWPLLKSGGWISEQESALVVDCSGYTPVLIWGKQGQPQAVRIVAPAVRKMGKEAVQQELQWLLNDQLRMMGATPDKVILLNVTEPLQLPDQMDSVAPTLSELAAGLEGWNYLHVAGIALALGDKELSSQQLNFRSGSLAGEINWRGWLAPWRAAAAVLLMVGIVSLLHHGVRYTHLNEQSLLLGDQVKAEFQKTLPGVPMVDPVAQIRQAYQKITGSSQRPVKPLGHWIALVQTAVPQETGVQWKQLLYDNGQLQLVGEVPSYDHLDRLQNALKSASGVDSIEMEKAQILSKSRHVQFNLKVM